MRHRLAAGRREARVPRLRVTVIVSESLTEAAGLVQCPKSVSHHYQLSLAGYGRGADVAGRMRILLWPFSRLGAGQNPFTIGYVNLQTEACLRAQTRCSGFVGALQPRQRVYCV